MKKILLTFFFSSLCLLLQAQKAQPWLEKKVSISVQDKTLETVLKSLENDLDGMVFAYLPGSFDVNHKVSIKLDSVPLQTVLEALFASQPVECSEMKGKIFLKKKKAGPEEKKGESPAKRRRRELPARSQSEAGSNQTDTLKSNANAERQSQKKGATSEEEMTASASANQEIPPWVASFTPVYSEVATKATGGTQASGMNNGEAMGEEKLLEESSTEIVLTQVPELLQVRWRSSMLTTQPAIGQQYVPPLPIAFTLTEEKKSFWSWFKMPAFLTRNPDKPARTEKTGRSVNAPDALKKRGFRFYLASGVGVSPLGDENGVKIGGRVMWQQKPTLAMGVGGYGLIGSTQSLPGETERFRIAGGYGGFQFEYTSRPDNPIHFSFPLLIAAGEVTYVDAINGSPLPNITEDGTQVFMVLEPGAMLELNAFSFMRIGLNVNYRYTTNSEIRYSTGEVLVSNNGMNGITAGITIKVGRF